MTIPMTAITVRHTTFIARIVAVGLLFLTIFFVGIGEAQAAEEKKAVTREIVVQLGIPGLTHNCTLPENIDRENPDKPRQCVNDLGDYISVLYRFLAGGIVIVSAVMVMWGGFKWLTASGNTGRVQDAKDVIYSSVIAILLVLGSYILLFTINPQLVSLKLPDISSVVRIEQASAICNENPSSVIDFGGVDCATEECCGKEFRISISDGTSIPCIWLASDDYWGVCATKDERPDRTSRYESYPIGEYCRFNNDGDRCIAADQYVQKQKTKTGEPKFINTSCGKEVISGQPDFGCSMHVLLSRWKDLEVFPAGYESKFIDCFTPGAEGVCWERENGNPVARYCSNKLGVHAQRCRNPLSSPRPVSKANGGCLVKIGQEGSTNPDDYRCWDVPDPAPTVTELMRILPHP